MRDLAIFCDEKGLKKEQKAGILVMSGSGISHFYWVGMRET